MNHGMSTSFSLALACCVCSAVIEIQGMVSFYSKTNLVAMGVEHHCHGAIVLRRVENNNIHWCIDHTPRCQCQAVKRFGPCIYRVL